MAEDKRIKVLLCCIGVETHNRGILTVAGMLRDAGMEVIYLGNALPEEVIKIAVQEDVDVVGISSASGAHLTVGKDLLDLARSEGVYDQITFLIGGVIPTEDIQKLKNMGFANVFPSGSTRQEIVNGVKEAVSAKA